MIQGKQLSIWFIGTPTSNGITLSLCSTPHTLQQPPPTGRQPQRYNHSGKKTSHGFRLGGPKVPLKPPYPTPPWCEECCGSSWKRTAAAVFAAVLKTNIHSPLEGQYNSNLHSLLPRYQESWDQRDKNQAAESALTIGDPGSTGFPLHTEPSATTTTHTHTQAQSGRLHASQPLWQRAALWTANVGQRHRHNSMIRAGGGGDTLILTETLLIVSHN